MTEKKIDSHSSQLNNKRLQFLLIDIDTKANTASTTLRFQEIVKYFNSIEQFYINIKDVIQENANNKIQEIRKHYYRLHDLIITSRNYQTVTSLNMLLRACRRYNSAVITALQSDLEYFLRTGRRDTKGLLNIPFYDGMDNEDE